MPALSRRLVRDAHSPAWSADGRRLAFASVRDNNGTRCGGDECHDAGELYVAAADGSAPVRLTDDEGEDGDPAWSPDGSRLLFTSERNLPRGDGAIIAYHGPDADVRVLSGHAARRCTSRPSGRRAGSA